MLPLNYISTPDLRSCGKDYQESPAESNDTGHYAVRGKGRVVWRLRITHHAMKSYREKVVWLHVFLVSY